MATPEHIRQQQYRERRAARLAQAEAMEAALVAIIARLEGNTKPVATELRAIAEGALNGRKAT